MTQKISHSPHWVTSSFGHPADFSLHERTALSEHMSLCAALRNPLQAVQGGISAVHAVLADRVITSISLATALVGGAWLLR